MDLKTYLELRGSNSLTSYEKRKFCVPDFDKGWTKRYKNLQLADNLVLEVVTYLLDSGRCTNPRVRANLVKIINPLKLDEVDSQYQYLYLVKNEIGNTKIGVSKDPLRRVRNITTGSGLLTTCVCFWDIEGKSTLAESAILHHFRRYKLQGEWFKGEILTPYKVESVLMGNSFIFKRFY